MSFNLPENVTGFFDLVKYANSVTDGWFVTLLLVAVFFVSFFSLKVYTTPRAYAGASFITCILAIFFFILKLIDIKILVLSVIMVITAIVWLIYADKMEL